MILAAAASAQNQGSSGGYLPGPSTYQGGALRPGGISLEIKDVPLKQAFIKIFSAAMVQPEQYMIDPALDKPPYDKVTVTMKLENASFSDALQTLARAHDLVADYQMAQMKWVVGPKPQVSVNTSYQNTTNTGGWPEQMLSMDPLIMHIPPTTVADALQKIMPGWLFKDDLGKVKTPEINLYRFPRGMAAALVLISAGLVPPSDDTMLVQKKGKVRLSDLFQWTATGLGYGTHEVIFAAPSSSRSEIAVGAYKGKDGQWLYTVLASRISDSELVEALFSTTGMSFVRVKTPSTPEASITAQIYDVTLDQAVASLLNPIGLGYRKQGPPDNPTYTIQYMGTPTK